MMKTSSTPLSGTKVFIVADNVYRAIIPFSDESSIKINFRIIAGKIRPCTLADEFIYTELLLEIQEKLLVLAKKL